MELKRTKLSNVSEAIRTVNSLIQAAKSNGQDVLRSHSGPHLYPGDVYDAYEAIRRKPTFEDILEVNECGPLAAVFLYRAPEADPSIWREYVRDTFGSRYVAGFHEGFNLLLPHDVQDLSTDDEPYLCGVYEGVMAHAAVF